MLGRLMHKILSPKALVLMYHRVADMETDVWDIAVSPAKFEQQLQVLREKAHVIPLKELVQRVKENKNIRNQIAISFDDGYADNYEVARPMLEKYDLPATFFITSGNIINREEFWWDELEQLLLHALYLPAHFSMMIGDSKVETDLQGESNLDEVLRTKHRNWKACEASPPTRRSALFMRLWQLLRPMTYDQQQEHLQTIRVWSNSRPLSRDGFKCVSLSQLQALGQSRLIDVGSHTVHHPALSNHCMEYQKDEMMVNKRFLEEVIGNEVSLLAYPYGNYSNDTLNAVASTGFAAAFTTEPLPLRHHTHPYSMGRFQVKNLDAQEFAAAIEIWKR